MKVLKSFVRNRNQPEGCIAKAQVCEEAVQLCSDFLARLDPIGLGSLNSREDKQTDRPLSAGTYVHPDIQQLKQAYLHILQNTEEVHPYIEYAFLSSYTNTIKLSFTTHNLYLLPIL